MGFQRFIFLGNMVRDAEIRASKDGKTIAKFSVAIQERKDEPTFFANVTAFGRLADVIQHYTRKGSAVLIEGKWESHEFNDKRYQSVIATSVSLVGSRSVDNAPAQPAQPAQEALPTFGEPAPQQENMPF